MHGPLLEGGKGIVVHPPSPLKSPPPTPAARVAILVDVHDCVLYFSLFAELHGRPALAIDRLRVITLRCLFNIHKDLYVSRNEYCLRRCHYNIAAQPLIFFYRRLPADICT